MFFCEAKNHAFYLLSIGIFYIMVLFSGGCYSYFYFCCFLLANFQSTNSQKPHLFNKKGYSDTKHQEDTQFYSIKKGRAF